MSIRSQYNTLIHVFPYRSWNVLVNIPKVFKINVCILSQDASLAITVFVSGLIFPSFVQWYIFEQDFLWSFKVIRPESGSQFDCRVSIIYFRNDSHSHALVMAYRFFPCIFVLFFNFNISNFLVINFCILSYGPS